jgi:hypothetical protein
MAVNLSPVGGVAAQFFDNSGNVLTGGKIYTYAAGTTTNQATYASATGVTAHSNPIILDASGRVPGGEIWLTDGLSYKFLVKTSTEVLIGSYDNIAGINSNFINFLTETEIQTATAGQTVFTLTTMDYQPGTNSLSVFVDGVNQYDGVSYSYVETNSTTVTFTAGLHVGALVKFTTAQTLSSGVTDASLVTYDPPFAGSVPTNVEIKLSETVSVMDFGAVGNGVADDTAAILAAIAYLQTKTKKSLFFPAGTYLISAPLVITGTEWEIYGDGCSVSVLKTTANDDIIRVDRTVDFAGRSEIRDLGFDRVFTMPYSNSCGIRIESNSTTGGVYAFKFTELQFQHLYRCIRFGPTQLDPFNGILSITKHSFCQFTNLKVLASTAFQPFECISFDEGCGPHHTITGGNLFATGVGSSGIRVGNGGVDIGFGDLLIYGVHITDSETGVNLLGPTGAGVYNENVAIVSCQFDGAGMNRTINAERMTNCRFYPNNSTASGNVRLIDCSRIAYQNSVNNLFFPRVRAGNLVDISNGNSLIAQIQAHTNDAYVQDWGQWSNDTVGGIKTSTKSRGSIGTHVAVQSGDTLSEDRYAGSNGVSFIPGVQVAVNAAATPIGTDTHIPAVWRVRNARTGTSGLIDTIIADERGNVVLGGNNSAVPTPGTFGFIYLQKMSGVPTGTPEKTYAGKVPMIVDETNSRIYVNIGGTWKYAQLV